MIHYEPMKPIGKTRFVTWAMQMHDEAFKKRRLLSVAGRLSGQTRHGAISIKRKPQ